MVSDCSKTFKFLEKISHAQPTSRYIRQLSRGRDTRKVLRLKRLKRKGAQELTKAE